MVYVRNINRLSPPHEGEPVGSTKEGILKTYAWNYERVPFAKHPPPHQKKKKKSITFLQEAGVWMRLPASPKYGKSTAVCNIVNEPASDNTLSEPANQNLLWRKQRTLIMDIGGMGVGVKK